MSRVPLPLPDPPLGEGSTVLRSWVPTDAAALAAAWADPEIQRWTGVPARADETAAGLWIAGEADRRARGLALDLVAEVDGVVAGEVGLAHIDVNRRAAEIGWWIAADHRGGGLGATIVRMLAEWALGELLIDSLAARCHPDNPASGAVASAAGFMPAGRSGEFDLWRSC